MKYSARLVTALAAITLLVAAIVGLTTEARASAVPVSIDTAPVVVQAVDLPAVLDLEGGGTELASVIDRDIGSGKTFLLATTFDQTHEVRTTQVITSALATDIGAITAIVAVGLAAIAFTNATTLDVRHFTRDMVTWLRTRRHHGAGAPINGTVDTHTYGDDGRPADGTKGFLRWLSRTIPFFGARHIQRVA